MLKSRKYVSIFLAVVMLLSIGCIGASAGDAETPIEVGPHPGQEASPKTHLSEEDYEAIINEMIQTRIETYTPSKKDFVRAQKIIDLYDAITPETRNGETVLSSFDDNWYKLRYGNLIELTLDYEEGITNSVAANCIALSRTAESEAKDNFPSYRDSAQHFIWNFKMADTYSKATARTIANNHEWGIAMIDPMLNHFELGYNEYIADGYNEYDASSQALADTITYMPIFKYNSVCIIETSYDFFDSFFSDESIMDFWNNCYGRAYPKKGYTSGIKAFRYSAFTVNELVLDGTTSMAENLTANQKKSVWAWDWYSY